MSTDLFEYMPPRSLSCNNNKHLTYPPPSCTQLFPTSSINFLTRLTWLVLLVELELLTLWRTRDHPRCWVRFILLNSVIGGARTAYPLEDQRSPPVLSQVHIAHLFLFCVMFCQPFFVCSSIFRSAIVLSVLRFTASDYPIVSSNVFIYYYCKLNDDYHLVCLLDNNENILS